MSSNVVRCHKHDCSQRLNRERRRREVNERKERRYVRQKGKSLRIRHQKRAGGQARQNHAEQRELKPPVFSCLPLFYSKTFIRPVFRLDMWNFMDYEIRPLQAAHILYPCVTSVAVCPCNRFSNRIWIAAAFFFVKIFHGEAARKISTKRFGKCGRQDKFDFPLMRGKTVSQTNLSGNSVQAHFLVKGRAADSQQGRCLCQVPFRDGKSRLDLFYVSSFIFLQTLVYLLFPHGVRNGLSRILEP